MPNWCECDLVVRGQPEDVDAFLAFARKEYTPETTGDDESWMQHFDFNAFIPYPEHFRAADVAARAWDREASKRREAGEDISWGDRPKDGFNQGGYEWCAENWATKWPATETRLGERKEYELVAGKEVRQMIHFSTAWAPPLPVVRKAAETFPNLTFDLRYYECGAAFHGRLKLENGKEVVNRHGMYHGDRGG
jgi:hypothetical protein